jgi:phosphoglycerate kinase
MKIKTIDKYGDLKGKTVFLRVDFNVPLEKGRIKDERKIDAGLPTIEHLIRNDCKIIIGTHLGRPQGKTVAGYSTKPLARKLSEFLGTDQRRNKVPHTQKFGRIRFTQNISGKEVKEAASGLDKGQVLFLENLRFDKREEVNDKKFAKELAAPADIYVNNAFSVSHRKHASVHAIKKFLPAYAGLLLAKEVESLERIRKGGKGLVIILGGAKIKTKLPLINNLYKRASKILIGGALANNFFVANNLQVGRSLVDTKRVAATKRLIRKIPENKLVLPVDVVVANKKTKQAKVKVKNIHNINKSEYILDIGPETLRIFSKHIKKGDVLIWNGPMGLFENDKFKHGSLSIGRLVASRSKNKAFGLAGGGETVQALGMTGMLEYMDWVSTGGGAMLSYLGSGKMPGLEDIIY